MKLAEVRRQEAKSRQEVHDKLNVEQKLKRLDEKFGPGQGAKKERAKLLAHLNAPKAEAPVSEPVPEQPKQPQEKSSGKKGKKNKKTKQQS